jgi:hypothetical protein
MQSNPEFDPVSDCSLLHPVPVRWGTVGDRFRQLCTRLSPVLPVVRLAGAKGGPRAYSSPFGREDAWMSTMQLNGYQHTSVRSPELCRQCGPERIATCGCFPSTGGFSRASSEAAGLHQNASAVPTSTMAT